LRCRSWHHWDWLDSPWKAARVFLGRLGNNLPLSLECLHQSGDLRQTKAGEPTVLEARDRRLVNPARALEPSLGPPVSEAGATELDPEQPKALHLPIGERPAFGTAQRFHRADRSKTRSPDDQLPVHRGLPAASLDAKNGIKLIGRLGKVRSRAAGRGSRAAGRGDGVAVRPGSPVDAKNGIADEGDGI